MEVDPVRFIDTEEGLRGTQSDLTARRPDPEGRRHAPSSTIVTAGVRALTIEAISFAVLYPT